MKNVLIVILTMALSAGAFLTRPNEDDFHKLVARQASAAVEQPAQPAKSKKAKKQAKPARETPSPLAKAELVDRIFWVEVRKDGQTLYAGCFNHWWDSSGRMQRM